MPEHKSGFVAIVGLPECRKIHIIEPNRGSKNCHYE